MRVDLEFFGQHRANDNTVKFLKLMVDVQGTGVNILARVNDIAEQNPQYKILYKINGPDTHIALKKLFELFDYHHLTNDDKLKVLYNFDANEVFKLLLICKRYPAHISKYLDMRKYFKDIKFYSSGSPESLYKVFCEINRITPCCNFDYLQYIIDNNRLQDFVLKSQEGINHPNLHRKIYSVEILEWY